MSSLTPIAISLTFSVNTLCLTSDFDMISRLFYYSSVFLILEFNFFVPFAILSTSVIICQITIHLWSQWCKLFHYSSTQFIFTFIFFPVGKGLSTSWLDVSKLVSQKKIQTRSKKHKLWSCPYPFCVVFPCLHTLVSCSHTITQILTHRYLADVQESQV